MNRALVLVIAAGVPLAIFWRTAYPTITWWDSSNYSLAAATLGIAPAPGALILTILGWPLSRLPLGLTPAHILNLFAGVLAALASWLVYAVARRVLRSIDDPGAEEAEGATAIGAALGALTFAFSATLWEHAIKFTPYVLSAVFTALILLALVRWWETAERRESWRWLALLALLFGLDFSVHRTNALMLPGALVWILIRQPGTVLRPSTWLAGGGGLLAGLALHLVLIPIAALTRAPLVMGDPADFSRFWDYVSLAQFGGGFLVELWPRNSGLWSVQAADLTRVFAGNFLHVMKPLLLAGLLPGVAGAGGLVLMWRGNRRFGTAFAVLLAMHAAMTVLYFNIPAEYFRSFDRHYLPVFVTFAVPVACGMGALGQRLAMLARKRAKGLVAAGAGFLSLAPAAQLAGNWTTHDASGRYFTRDYAANALGALPPNAIYFTAGDNDTFPLLYLQAAEGVRPDVRIVNLSLANAAWYMARIRATDRSFPAPLAGDARRAVHDALVNDTTLVIPVGRTAAQLGLPADATIPRSITVRPRPRFAAQPLPADEELLGIVLANAWRDPLTFAVTVGASGLGWLEPYGRLEGLFWRIVPVEGVRADAGVLRANLLERYSYRGYADPSIRIDDVSRIIGLSYFTSLAALAEAEAAQGALDRCRDAVVRLFAALPPERLEPSAETRAAIEASCRS